MGRNESFEYLLKIFVLRVVPLVKCKHHSTQFDVLYPNVYNIPIKSTIRTFRHPKPIKKGFLEICL